MARRWAWAFVTGVRLLVTPALVPRAHAQTAAGASVLDGFTTQTETWAIQADRTLP